MDEPEGVDVAVLSQKKASGEAAWMQPKTTPPGHRCAQAAAGADDGGGRCTAGPDISRGAVARTGGASRSRRSLDATVALRDGDFTGFAAEIVGPSRGTAGRDGRRRARGAGHATPR